MKWTALLQLLLKPSNHSVFQVLNISKYWQIFFVFPRSFTEWSFLATAPMSHLHSEILVIILQKLMGFSPPFVPIRTPRQPANLHIPIWIHLSLETGTGIQVCKNLNLILRLLSTLSAAHNSVQRKSGIPIGQGSMQCLLQIRWSSGMTWTQIWSG